MPRTEETTTRIASKRVTTPTIATRAVTYDKLAQEVRGFFGAHLPIPRIGDYIGSYGASSVSFPWQQDTVFYLPIVINKTVSVDQIAVYSTSAGTKQLKLGLYASDGVIPTTRLENPGSVSLTPTGLKTLAIARILTPDLYFTAGIADGGTLGEVKGNTLINFAYGVNLVGIMAYAHIAGNYADGLPATAVFDSQSTGNEAMVVLRRSA
jgi:hypothetical protein